MQRCGAGIARRRASAAARTCGAGCNASRQAMQSTEQSPSAAGNPFSPPLSAHRNKRWLSCSSVLPLPRRCITRPSPPPAANLACLPSTLAARLLLLLLCLLLLRCNVWLGGCTVVTYGCLHLSFAHVCMLQQGMGAQHEAAAALVGHLWQRLKRCSSGHKRPQLASQSSVDRQRSSESLPSTSTSTSTSSCLTSTQTRQCCTPAAAATSASNESRAPQQATRDSGAAASNARSKSSSVACG